MLKVYVIEHQTGCFRNFGIPLLVPYTKDFERITQF